MPKHIFDKAQRDAVLINSVLSSNTIVLHSLYQFYILFISINRWARKKLKKISFNLGIVKRFPRYIHFFTL